MAYYNEDGSVDYSRPDDRPTAMDVFAQRQQEALSTLNSINEKQSRGEKVSSVEIKNAINDAQNANYAIEQQSIFQSSLSEQDWNARLGIKIDPPTTFLTATPPAPEPEMFSARMFSAPPVKTATLDIILFDEENIPTDGMFDQIFENIGGQELISITRSDIVNGQKISYQPIKNLSAIQQRYNSNNILSLQQTADKFFAGFSIKLEDKIPETGNGTNGENVYLNASGDLIIEFINVNPDEQVETQISVSGTIYEADLGDYASW